MTIRRPETSALILPFPVRHVDLARTPTPESPGAVRVPRPLRDLLHARFDDIAVGCRAAWTPAAASAGEWVTVDAATFVAPEQVFAIDRLQLRATEGHLDMRVGYRDGALASAVGRRVIAVVPRIPDTLANAAAGQPLSRLLDAPFLGDAKIVIQRVIARESARMTDIRCRCPSHLVPMGAPPHRNR